MIGLGLKILGVGRWLFGDWRRIGVLFLLMILASGWWRAWSIDGDRDHWRATASAEQAAHVGTTLNYRMAAIRAQQIAFANRATVEARWRAQYEEAVDAKAAYERDYRANLANWLRRNTAPAGDPSRAHGIDVPAPAGSTGGTDNHASSAIVPVTDLERCAAAFAHLSALIGWVNAASAVDTSPDTVVKSGNVVDAGGVGENLTFSPDG